MRTLLVICWTWVVCVGSSVAEENITAEQVAKVNANVMAAESEQAKQARDMMYTDMKARRQQANLRESRLWRKIQNKQQWEAYRDERLDALRRSWGISFEVGTPPQVEVTKRIEGDGYVIENLVFVSHPKLVVTANLYRPAKPVDSMPGILICHSHHAPKTQGELQDMGITWAKQGCLVLVMDQLGHGERRQHPFATSDSFEREFRVSRQDYYFRYDEGIQLHLIGDSLMAWMVRDLRRGVDLLLSRKGIDPKRIILLGAVAGGGDPATVTASLDERITAAVAFNFGGPQPETVFPLPEQAEDRFNYAGGGSWESTRNLTYSTRDGFMPWVLAGAIAPRGLIYTHEFAWDKDNDPVWKRLQKIQGFYGVERLASVKGRGSVRLRPPEATHCTNIGPVHREQIYPTLEKWFQMPIPQEIKERRSASELACLTPAVVKKFDAKPMHELAAEVGRTRSREQVAWEKVLGDIEPRGKAKVVSQEKDTQPGFTSSRLLLEVEKGIVVPVVLLVPTREGDAKCPVVVAVSQSGKAKVLAQHADAIAACLSRGVAVCLPDVRGTGETSIGSSPARQSSRTGLSSSELMLGQTCVGMRLRDLRSVLAYLRTRDDIDTKQMLLWGTSFARVNPADQNIAVPRGIDNMPAVCEPLGGLLAMLGALYEKDVNGVCVQGGLLSYQSVLESPFVYIPHDVVVPGAIKTGDLPKLADELSSRAVRLEGLVDGRNKRVDEETLRKSYPAGIELHAELSDDAELAKWMLGVLRR